jgi:hypothetical protein
MIRSRCQAVTHYDRKSAKFPGLAGCKAREIHWSNEYFSVHITACASPWMNLVATFGQDILTSQHAGPLNSYQPDGCHTGVNERHAKLTNGLCSTMTARPAISGPHMH